MSELVVYERACIALAEAKRVDEVLEIYSRTAAVRAYAQQSKNRALELDAVEIRLRATRRLGQLLNAIIDERSLEQNQTPNIQLSEKQILALVAKECGVNYNLAVQARKMATNDDAQYARLIGEWRQRCADENKVSTRLLPKEAAPPPSRYVEPEPERKPPGPLDQYFISIAECAIGDVPFSSIEGFIAELNEELLVLIAIKDHAGDVEQLAEATKDQILIRHVISHTKFDALLKELRMKYAA